MTLRLAFMGTPDFAVPTLDALIKAGHDIACVYSQPPRRAGRGMELRKSPVQVFAEDHDLEVRHPNNLKDQTDRDAFAALNLDVAVVVAYGLILPQVILDSPKLGCFNGHASLLPRWRGAAPIQRAIMSGDTQTGVTIMKMDIGLDTGNMCLVGKTEITATTTASDLHDELALLTGDLMVKALTALEAGSLEQIAQPEDGVLYAAKIDKAEARIDWTDTASTIDCKIRGLSPFPGGYTEINGKRLKLLRCKTINDLSGEPGTILDDHLTIACGDGAVRLVQVQPAGKKPMDAGSFLRGYGLKPGTRIG